MNNTLANSNNNASYKILKYGVEYKKNQIKELYSEDVFNANLKKYIHIHDSEYSDISYNCLGISYKERLEKFINKLNEEFEFEDILNYILKDIITLTNLQSGGIGILNLDLDLEKYIGNLSEKELIKNFRRFFEVLNTDLRKGTEKAYTTFNIGLSTSSQGRMITKSILKAYLAGNIGDSRPFIFPNIVFKLKEGINKKIGDINYDLFELAMIVSSKRMNPTYFNCDAIHVKNIPMDKVGIMGCRTLMAKNKYGDMGGEKRGNIACVTINLPKLAENIKSEDDLFKNLEKYLELSKKSLLERFKLLEKVQIENFKYIIDNEMYLETEKNQIYEIFKNGSLSIGFIGLFDCISKLKNEEITKQMIYANLELAEKIVSFMKDKIDEYSEIENFNFSLLATSGEGISGRFAENEKIKKYYTNSYHVPVYIDINPFEKLEIESKFSKYCSGGSISYIEYSAPILYNYKSIEDILNYGLEKGIIYLGINFPLDFCRSCSEVSIFEENACSKCGSNDIIRLRRVSGYLSEKDTLKTGKKEEERERKSHL